MFLSIVAAAILLGALISTFRRWEKEGSVSASHRTCGGHRRCSRGQINEFFGDNPDGSRGTKAIGYARVSSHD